MEKKRKRKNPVASLPVVMEMGDDLQMQLANATVLRALRTCTSSEKILIAAMLPETVRILFRGQGSADGSVGDE